MGKLEGQKVKWFERLLAVAAGAVFVYAGVVKIGDPERFAMDIHNFRLLPWNAALGLAFLIPWMEVVCGLALCLKRAFHGALLCLSLMAGSFLAATISGLVRGLDISCGCFGSANKHSLWVTAGIDLLLLVVLLHLWRKETSRTSLPEA